MTLMEEYVWTYILNVTNSMLYNVVKFDQIVVLFHKLPQRLHKGIFTHHPPQPKNLNGKHIYIQKIWKFLYSIPNWYHRLASLVDNDSISLEWKSSFGACELACLQGKMGSLCYIKIRNILGAEVGHFERRGSFSVTPQRPSMAWAIEDLVFRHIRSTCPHAYGPMLQKQIGCVIDKG